MYSMPLGPRCFKWKMLSLSGPKALLFLQLLIVLLTRSVVNVCRLQGFPLCVSLVNNRVSPEEVCFPNFDVLNCCLNLTASCLDDENELPLKVIASFFCVCRYGSGCHNSVFTVHSRWDLFYGGHLVFITSNLFDGTGSSWSLCRPVGMWSDAALSRIVRNIFSSLWQSVGRECLLRAASSCLYLSQLAFFMLT